MFKNHLWLWIIVMKFSVVSFLMPCIFKFMMVQKTSLNYKNKDLNVCRNIIWKNLSTINILTDFLVTNNGIYTLKGNSSKNYRNIFFLSNQ